MKERKTGLDFGRSTGKRYREASESKVKKVWHKFFTFVILIITRHHDVDVVDASGGTLFLAHSVWFKVPSGAGKDLHRRPCRVYLRHTQVQVHQRKLARLINKRKRCQWAAGRFVKTSLLLAKKYMYGVLWSPSLLLTKDSTGHGLLQRNGPRTEFRLEADSKRKFSVASTIFIQESGLFNIFDWYWHD